MANCYEYLRSSSEICVKNDGGLLTPHHSLSAVRINLKAFQIVVQTAVEWNLYEERCKKIDKCCWLGQDKKAIERLVGILGRVFLPAQSPTRGDKFLREIHPKYKK